MAPEIGTQHVLTISHAFTPDRLLTLAIATFEKQNPGWSVHVLHPINDAAMAGTDFFGILSSIMVDLMAGRGADLIQFLFLPDPQQLIRKGMLLPLDPILSSDAEFDIRAFRKSVVDAMRTGGNLYFFPLSFSQSVLYAGAQKLGLIDDRAWTWPDFFDACIAAMDAVNGHVPTRFAFPKIDANSFFSMYVLPALAEAYIDRSASESHFNDLSFIRILEGTKEFCPLNGQGNPYGDGDFFKGIQKGDIFLLFASLNGPRDLAMYAEVFPNGVRVLSVPHVGASGDAFVTCQHMEYVQGRRTCKRLGNSRMSRSPRTSRRTRAALSSGAAQGLSERGGVRPSDCGGKPDGWRGPRAREAEGHHESADRVC